MEVRRKSEAPGEFRAALQAHGIGKLERPGRWSGHSAAVQSNGCETPAALAATAGDNVPTLPGRVALEKTMLPNAADFRWLICTFHNSLNLIVSFSPSAGPVQPLFAGPRKNRRRENISEKGGVKRSAA